MPKLIEMVEDVLTNTPSTRNSDISLTLNIWRKYYPQYIQKIHTSEESVLTYHLFDLPREDNVKRIRAKFNSEGKYLPTDWVVAKNRGIKEDEWREALGYPPKELSTLGD